MQKTAFDPLSKKRIQCSHKIRKDHYSGKNHKCSFGNLEDFIKKKESASQKNDNDLNQYVYILIGKKNLPISTAVSKEFYDVLREFYESGQKNPNTVFSSISPLFSRKTFTKNLIITWFQKAKRTQFETK